MNPKLPLASDALGVTIGARAILSDIDLTFAPGQVTAVIGPNGAGKSTLLTCLAGLLEPTSGTVRLGEERLSALPNRERARRIGLLPQSQEIAWAVDVETLVGLGRLPYAGILAGGLGMQDKVIVAAAMEHTRISLLARQAVTTLSGGERGRALLARAMAGQPDWLLADEPLTGLDPAHQFDACDLLRRVANEGRGVIVTLHDLSLAARLADRVVVLAEGRVVADGTPREALTEALLARVYGVDARVETGDGDVSITILGRAR